jgi:hypothetical protein
MRSDNQNTDDNKNQQTNFHQEMQGAKHAPSASAYMLYFRFDITSLFKCLIAEIM